MRQPRRGGAAAAGRTRQGRGKHGGECHGAAGRKGERERADGWVRFLQGQRRHFMWCGVLETKIKEWSVLCTISKSGVCCAENHHLGMCHIPISQKIRGKRAIGSWNEGTCAICPKEIDSEYGCDNNSTLFVCDLLGRFYGMEIVSI